MPGKVSLSSLYILQLTIWILNKTVKAQSILKDLLNYSISLSHAVAERKEGHHCHQGLVPFPTMYHTTPYEDFDKFMILCLSVLKSIPESGFLLVTSTQEAQICNSSKVWLKLLVLLGKGWESSKMRWNLTFRGDPSWPPWRSLLLRAVEPPNPAEQQ